MADLLTALALLVLLATGLGLFAVLRSRSPLERLMAVQLLGSGGTAILLILATASAAPALVDVALLLTLFAAFGSAAFALGEPDRAAGGNASGGDEA